MIFNLNTIDQTQHLPECWAKDPSDPPAWCICDELRACEERVLNSAVQRVIELPDLLDAGFTYSGLLRREAVIEALKEKP